MDDKAADPTLAATAQATAPIVAAPVVTLPPTASLPSVVDGVKKAASDAIVTGLKLYLPIMTTALTSLQNTSSIANVAAQAAQAQATVISTFPELEQDEIKILAADTNTFVEALGLFLQQQAANLGQPSTGAASENAG